MTTKRSPLYYFPLVAAFIYSIFDMLAFRYVSGLPERFAAMDFPFNAIAQTPEFIDAVNIGSLALIVLSLLFLLGGLGLLLRKKGGYLFAIFAPMLQIAGTVYLGFYYYDKVFPLIGEIFLLMGRPDNAWLYELRGVIIIGELSVILPELMLVFLLLQHLKKKNDRCV